MRRTPEELEQTFPFHLTLGMELVLSDTSRIWLKFVSSDLLTFLDRPCTEGPFMEDVCCASLHIFTQPWAFACSFGH